MESSQSENTHGKDIDNEVRQLSASLADSKLEDAKPRSLKDSSSYAISEDLTINDNDYSWIIRLNLKDYPGCRCPMCVSHIMAMVGHPKHARLLLDTWNELRSYLRMVYLKPPVKAVQLQGSAFRDNPRLHEIVKCLKNVNPSELLLKIETEVANILIAARTRILSHKKPDTCQRLAAEYLVKALVKEYMQLCSSALFLGPVIKQLIEPALSELQLTWEILNKHLYLELIYRDKGIRDFVPAGFDQMKSLLSSNDEISLKNVVSYHLWTLHSEMEGVASDWSKAEIHIRNDRAFRKGLALGLQDIQIALRFCLSRGMLPETRSDEQGMNWPPCKRNRSRKENLRIYETFLVPGFNLKGAPRSISPPNLEKNKFLNPAFFTEVQGFTDEMGDISWDEVVALGKAALYPDTDFEDGGVVPDMGSLVMHVLSDRMKRGCKRVKSSEKSKREKRPIGNDEQEPICPENGESLPDRPHESVNESPSTSSKLPPPAKDNAKKVVGTSTVKKTRKKTEENPTAAKPAAPPTKKSNTKPSGSCRKPGVCGHCTKPGNTCNRKAEKHLAAIARLGLSKYGPKSANKPKQVKQEKSPEAISKIKVSTKHTILEEPCDLMDGDDSSVEDTYSVISNSSDTSASTSQKDPKHCDCCYCEVFGHGVTVAPVSRNFQEMRERLRSRLNKKKKSKSVAQSQPTTANPPGNNPVAATSTKITPPESSTSSETTKEEDLNTLLQYIEGNGKIEVIDEKKLAKRARQKQKKQEEREEKERQEKEAERLRIEALKKSSKKNKKATRGSQVTAAPSASKPVTTIAGLKNLVAQPPNDGEPKMVTIRRVIEPFGSEPTVTISIKGSSPDKDEVLFTLDNLNSDSSQSNSTASEKSKKNKTKNSKKELSVKDVPPVHQKRVLEILNESQTKKATKGGTAAKSPVAQKPANGPNSCSSNSKATTKPQSASAAAARKTAPTSVPDASMSEANKFSNEFYKLGADDAVKQTPSPVEVTFGRVTVTPTGASSVDRPVFRLSEVLDCIAPAPTPPREEIKLENLRLPPGITITKIDGPKVKTVRASDEPGPITKPSPITPPIVLSPTVRQPLIQPRIPASQTSIKPSSAGNVIVVDTGKLKQVMKENGIANTDGQNKKKKKKKKKGSPELVPTPPSPMSQQATIIKTSDNMVTIRSPQLQHAIDMQAANVNRLSDSLQGLRLTDENQLTQQVTRLSLADARAAFALPSDADRKKKRRGPGSGHEDDVEQPENVFKPKDIDLEDGDMDDDEREVEAFKRFCLQSVPAARKDKVKVNLNIKDIVVKKKSSAIGCS